MAPSTTTAAPRPQRRRTRVRVVVATVLALLASLPVAAQAAPADDATLAGRLVTADGSPWDASPWRVDAVPVAGEPADGPVGSSALVEPDGAFRLDALPPGAYRLRAVPQEEHTGIPPMWLGGTLRESDATVVDARAGSVVDGLEIVRLDAATVPRRASGAGRPFVKGTPRVGWTLTADPQAWEVEDDWLGQPLPVTADHFTYQWLADGRPVRGATRRTFRPTARQLGAGLTVRIGIDLPGTTLVTPAASRPTAAVVRGRNTPCSRVTLRGRAAVGRTLVARRSGCWTAPGTRVRHVWSVGGHRVATTREPYLRLRRAFRGERVSVRVVAVAPGYRTATVRARARTVH